MLKLTYTYFLLMIFFDLLLLEVTLLMVILNLLLLKFISITFSNPACQLPRGTTFWQVTRSMILKDGKEINAGLN